MRRITIAVAVAVVLLAGGGARAGTIVQVDRFDLLPHGSIFHSYTQLPPALSPLNAVTFDSTAVGKSDTYVLDNTSSDTISFTVTAVDYFGIDAGSSGMLRQTFAFTLYGHQFTILDYQINGGKPINAFTVVTSNLDQFVGPSFLSPYFINREEVTPDNPAIAIRHAYSGEVIYPTYEGIETITYYYGSSTFVPEPASLVSMSLGLTGVAVLAWRRQRRVR